MPSEFAFARDLGFPKQISGTLTLSTFHGCPADEIERICEFLIADRDLDVIVKMNPPMLGRERLEHLLHEVLGYTELTVNPAAYTSGLQFDESIQLTSRLTQFAHNHGRRFGCKFSNTLEVINHRTFFTPDNKVQYLSGQPLHVITMTLTDIFRQAVGPEVPISFSAGIDSRNFPLAVACGFVPVTVCSDLLRPGGYGRLPAYIKALAQAMRLAGAANIRQYIERAFDKAGDPLRNTSIAAEKARQDQRYRADANRKAPVRVDSHLVTFDCLTCDKCLPVCPNAANFTYPTPLTSFDYHDLIIDAAGQFRPDVAVRHFEIKETMQIANYADFCNECGNCDTFCPEYGGPYIKKPGFYSSLKSWQAAAPRDGFIVEKADGCWTLIGRIQSKEYRLTHRPDRACYEYFDGVATLELHDSDYQPLSCSFTAARDSDHLIALTLFHSMRHMLHGILDRQYVHQLNL
jgi:putative selenate reductase